MISERNFFNLNKQQCCIFVSIFVQLDLYLLNTELIDVGKKQN